MLSAGASRSSSEKMSLLDLDDFRAVLLDEIDATPTASASEGRATTRPDETRRVCHTAIPCEVLKPGPGSGAVALSSVSGIGCP